MKIDITRREFSEYRQAWRYQKELVNLRRSGLISDTLILTEHPAVITIGRKGRKSDGNVLVSDRVLDSKGIEVVEIDRGGDITLHCPGQLVCYPVMDLKNYGRDAHRYLRNLEEVIIGALGEHGIDSQRVEGATGVWVGDEKISSIGVGVTGWITYHGVSLNVCPDLEQYSLINMCGMKNARATSMKKILNRGISVDEVFPAVIEHFKKVFGNYYETTNSCGTGRQNRFKQC